MSLFVISSLVTLHHILPMYHPWSTCTDNDWNMPHSTIIQIMAADALCHSPNRATCIWSKIPWYIIKIGIFLMSITNQWCGRLMKITFAALSIVNIGARLRIQSTVEVKTWMSIYISYITMDVITYRYSNLSWCWSMLAKVSFSMLVVWHCNKSIFS